MNSNRWQISAFLLLAFFGVLLSTLSASATSTGVGQFAGPIYPGLSVTASGAYNFDPETGIPSNDPGCTDIWVDESNLIEMETLYDTSGTSSGFTDLPNLVTVSHVGAEDVWAIADCLPLITNIIYTDYPWVEKIVIDVDRLFYVGGFFDLAPHDFLTERAIAWWDRAMNAIDGSDPIWDEVFAGSDVWLVPLQEAARVSNFAANQGPLAIKQNWTGGPNWASTAERATGIAVAAHSFPRFDADGDGHSDFPHHYSIIVGDGYWTYNPSDEDHPRNYPDNFHDWIDEWERALRPGQKVAWNTRGFRHDTGDNSEWFNGDFIHANTVRWQHFAWCAWSVGQERFDLVGTTIWTWDSSNAEGGITGLNALYNENSQDANSDGVADLIEQDMMIFSQARNSHNGCSI